MSDYFDDLAAQLAQLHSQHRSRRLVPRVPDGVYLVEADGRRLLNFGSNDYLGLASTRSSDRTANGSMASPLVCGWSHVHAQLADELALFEETEAAVVFPSGFAACSGAVSTLPQRGDLLLSDALNHASLIEGCRLSRAERVVYPHRDVGFVGAILQQRRAEFQHAWIVTDGVFSMDGHVARLAELCDVAARYDTRVIVDEAHGTGVLGEHGRGVCEALGVTKLVPIRIGTLSKSLGSQGGFVAGPKIVCDYLVNRCRPLIYSTGLAPAAAAAAIDALLTVKTEPGRRQHVWNLLQRFRDELRLPADNSVEAQVPFILIQIGDDRRALTVASALADRGFYVPAIRPPTVPEGSARLRVSLSAAHTEPMIADLAAALASLEI